MSDDTWIDVAYDILRELNDGKEPYAASVLPMANALQKRFGDSALAQSREELAKEREAIAVWCEQQTTRFVVGMPQIRAFRECAEHCRSRK